MRLMNTREVAEYLRIKERKVYDLVREGRIPCTRVTGKWLFPKELVDRWLEQGTTVPGPEAKAPPPVVAGSHDPLLEWSLRESGCGLAMLAGGSLDGLRRLALGDAAVCGMHVIEPEAGGYNRATVEAACPSMPVILIHWAWRQQGLVLAPGNPLGIETVADLGAKKARLAVRQEDAGSQILLRHLLAEAGIDLGGLAAVGPPALSETDLALAIQDGKADVGVAVAAAAHQHRLAFVPLHRERYDLLLRRRDYFDAPVQALLAFAGTEAFRARAAEMDGYDVSELGSVRYNA
jgi:excisionase family DNA binding protein